VTNLASGFSEQALFEAPPGCLLESTADGEHVIVADHLGLGEARPVPGEDGVYVAELRSGERSARVYWDGRAGPDLDGLVPLPPDGALLRMSPDRRHVAYLAATGGRTRACVGVDDSLGPEFAGMSEDVFPTFSPTGGRIAYGALVEGVVRMVVDHVPELGFVPAPRPPLFDESGSRVAFVAVSPTGAERVVVGGVAQGEYAGIVGWGLGTGDAGEPLMLSSLAFGPDGELGYVALEGSGMLVVLDGVEGPKFDEIHPQIAFSPAGGRVAYPASRGRQMVCVVDGEAQESYDLVGRPVFSPDGSRLMYAVARGGKYALVVDGAEQGESSQSPVAYAFSPDGSRHAYLATVKRALRGDRRCCVVDGAPGLEFDAIETRPVFSPMGDHLAYVARRGQERFLVVDESPELVSGSAYFPAFSASGRLAYLAVESEAVAVVVDGREGPSFEEVVSRPGVPEASWQEFVEPSLFAFSPNGAHIAYTGLERGAGARAVVDGAVGPAYEVATFPAVDDRRARFYGWRDGFVHRATYDF
jgi:hypothetical protein